MLGKYQKRKNKSFEEIDFNSEHWEDAEEVLDPFDDSPSVDPVERYRRWHWGKAPTYTFEIDDDRFPEFPIEIGRIMELVVEVLDENGDRSNPVEKLALELDEPSINQSHVFFDHDHPKDRIYLYVRDDETREDLINLYNDWDSGLIELNSLAQLTEGVHSDMDDYPTVLVKPLGYLTDIVYYTHKSGDDDGIGSAYHHEMGEENGIHPILAISEDGTLWLAGGDYTCPNAGITN